jgi:uncharacterized RDD family membrane protein YckC
VISRASANVGFAPDAPAGAGRRLLAALIDWFLCLVVPLFAAAAYVSVAWLAILPLSVVCYFTFFLARGQTPGMRAAATHVVDERTGPPGARKALLRALVALLQVAALFALSNVALSDRPEGGYSSVDLGISIAASVVVASALLAHLWMFLDRRRQTVLDRIFRLEVQR